MGTLGEVGYVGRGLTESSVGRSLFPDRIIPHARELDEFFGVNGCLQKAEEFFWRTGYLPREERMPIIEKPIPHVYERDGILVVSSALYYVDAIVGKSALMVSLVPANRNATEHYHLSGIREYYELIAGEAHLKLKDKLINLTEDNRSHTIEEGTVHQFTTVFSQKPVITALIMENAGSVHRGNWHILTGNNNGLV